MSDTFHLFDEPCLRFGSGQDTEDPHDGLALFGPAEATAELPAHVAIGTATGLALWRQWVREFNVATGCEDSLRHRAWPPFPGFDVAFGCKWPNPSKEYQIDVDALAASARKADRHERVFDVSSIYLEPMEKQMPRLDAKPALAVYIVPDLVYANCRPTSHILDPVNQPHSLSTRRYLNSMLKDRQAGQRHFDFSDEADTLVPYGMAPDFRRQLKARVMEYDVPIQIVRESTLAITDDVRRGLPGVNPLSDRLWNLGTALFYKCGRKPWKTPWAREGVCYVGLAFRRDYRSKRTACCAAQMFLDSGDGIVFVGEFGPWYSEETKECHLSKKSAEALLRGTIEAYMQQDGRKLEEIFLHARSALNEEEFTGFRSACPQGVRLVGIRVRRDSNGPRLFRHDDHPEPSRRGKYPVLRGTFWQRTDRHGLLFTSGFKPRLGSYDGWEIPVPLSLSVLHGCADVKQVAKDILGLTKLNYNCCQLGESQPITVKYSDLIGEILISNSEVPRKHWKHNFKFYI